MLAGTVPTVINGAPISVLHLAVINIRGFATLQPVQVRTPPPPLPYTDVTNVLPFTFTDV